MDPRDPRPVPAARPLAELLRTLPARNAGRFGRPGDPWNLLFLGSGEAVAGALAAAGWSRIPPSTAASVAAGLGQVLRGERLTLFPPMNEYRQFGRPQDMNWALVTTPILRRHHFRLWRAPVTDDDGRPVWWGTANYDKAARFWDLSHVPDPDVDAERDFIRSTLGTAEASLEAAPGVPRSGENDKGYPFFTDGRVLVVRLG